MDGDDNGWPSSPSLGGDADAGARTLLMLRLEAEVAELRARLDAMGPAGAPAPARRQRVVEQRFDLSPRALRLLTEILFLAGTGVVLAAVEAGARTILPVMGAAWALVATFEWLASRRIDVAPWVRRPAPPGPDPPPRGRRRLLRLLTVRR